jgi:putative acetyltransferase
VTRAAAFSLRRYEARDEDAAIELWLRTWHATYPAIDFAARLDWWRERWRSELVPTTTITLAETGKDADKDAAGRLAGFVTVDPRTLYLDQLVVAPEHWGSPVAAALIAEAKRLSPAGLLLDVNIDNIRAIRFYQKRGFVITGPGKNPRSGKPVHRMRWQPA